MFVCLFSFAKRHQKDPKIKRYKINEQKSETLPFKAHLVGGGDHVFTVTPSSGLLPPHTTDGTLIKIGFTPSTYGKSFQAQLLITVSTTRPSWPIHLEM